MNLSYKQALWASYTILDTIYDEMAYHKLRFILSDMSPFTFEDRICADPALWEMWLKCSNKTNPAGSLTYDQVMTTLVDFLKVNEADYSCFKEEGGDYSTDEVVVFVSNYVSNGYWEKTLNEVVGHTETFSNEYES